MQQARLHQFLVLRRQMHASTAVWVHTPQVLGRHLPPPAQVVMLVHTRPFLAEACASAALLVRIQLLWLQHRKIHVWDVLLELTRRLQGPPHAPHVMRVATRRFLVPHHVCRVMQEHIHQILVPHRLLHATTV